MKPSCCPAPPARADAPACPVSGFAGESVDWTTVAALAVGALPPREAFRLCRDPGCDIVYYGSAGTRLAVDALHVHPGFKDASDGLVCYCFHHRRADIARQIDETGATDIFDSIREQVEAGNCACEVRNPSGRCCLQEVRQVTRELRQRRSLAT